MSNQTAPNLADFELLAARSDGFIEAERKADALQVLLYKLEGENLEAAEDSQFHAQGTPQTGLREPGGLELLGRFEEEGATYFVLSHFYGRALSVQMARGRKFTASEAMAIVRAVGSGLLGCNAVHGALIPSKVLLNDQKQVRLVPALLPPNAPTPTVASDIRQVALLFGHILLGEAPAELGDAAPALLNWTLKPEIPVPYRNILRQMLSPAGPHYQGWRDCLRDLERIFPVRPVAVKPRGRSGNRVLTVVAVLVALLAAGSWAWQRFGNRLAPQKSPLAETAPSAPAIAEAQPEAPATPAEAPSTPAASAETKDSKAIVDYTRTAGDALKLAAGRNYSGALDLLRKWLDAHPDDANRGAIQRQIGRIELAKAAMAALLQHGSELAGAPIDLGDKTPRKLAKFADGKVVANVTGQYGTVTTSIELSAIPDATIANWLTQLDAKAKTQNAPTFLLAGSHYSEARALLKNANTDQQTLLAWADEWQTLGRDRDALAEMDRIAGLVQNGDSGEAQAAIQHVRIAYKGSVIVTEAMATELYEWDQQLVAALTTKAPAPAPADAYPGLPKLSLTGAVQAGDPDFKRLASATQWAITHDGWRQHRDALSQTLASAANSGNWTQFTGNLQHILAEKTASVMLAQSTFLRSIDPETISDLPKDKDTQDFLGWLFTNPPAIENLAVTLRPEDKPGRVLEIWRDCWKEDRQDPDPYSALALAIAVDFDDPIRIDPNFYSMESRSESDEPKATDVNPVERYRFMRDSAKRGVLLTPLAELRTFELVWMVDAPVPTSELVWAQNNVKLSRRDWGKAYTMVRYRMDKAAGGRQIYDRYTLEEIKEKGGICGDRAYFASVTAKANGIPAMSIVGNGDLGAHAWFGYEMARNAWDLSSGRISGEHYAVGTSHNPQTHRSVKEQELRDLTNPERRTDGWASTERYLQLSDLLASAKLPEVSRVALDLAVASTPDHLGAWNRRLDAMEAAKISSEEWEREIAKMRVAFQKSPDILENIGHRETHYLETSGDNKAALAATERQDEHFVHRDKDRTDLILDTVYKEADLAQKSGDDNLAGKIYRDALREKGKEYVAFKALAPRYYQWAKGQSQGTEAAHEIDQAFDRNFKPPMSNYFALGSYHDTLEVVIDVFKKEGLDNEVHRLERKAEKVEDRRKEIGDQSKKAERE